MVSSHKLFSAVPILHNMAGEGYFGIGKPFSLSSLPLMFHFIRVYSGETPRQSRVNSGQSEHRVTNFPAILPSPHLDPTEMSTSSNRLKNCQNNKTIISFALRYEILITNDVCPVLRI